ncbi:ribosome small subunit-dependent GTPase A [Planctomicrobium piriforme]|uniref:Small ribosomal subunit biogenesis GTPase RsgA n=1 Tax=Planctomicrobium piriforme TaxID=1576369 RepID=A0A1I3B860_9PLAN|nr:ribosome small subunit-dependent GTPase A [Planctomicrobium piriforme]SFH58412.1 ribosome biogenesis GTPase [Planctomicrobium piriforme]
MQAAAKKKSRKIRVAFHKNRNKRKRFSDLTRQSEAELEATNDLSTTERLSGKGDLTRYRTIVSSDEGDDGAAIRDIDQAATLPGRVLTAVGSNQCRVEAADGQMYLCSVRRLVRTMSREGRNAVVAGDRVRFTPQADATGVIELVEPRFGTLSRVSRYKAHIIVSNIDQAVIVASVADPHLKLGLIDRFLCSAEKGGIRGVVCINKIDLGSRRLLQPVVGQYARLGYPVVLTDALSGEGIPELRRLLRGRETVFTGQSGVGKSSLLNAVQPGLWRRTGEVSSDTNKGRHTTRVTELLRLDAGGWVVDTPGIRTLQLWDIVKEELEGLFIEFRPFVHACRFPDCTHTHEQNCGIKHGVAHGLISPLRYDSYLRIFNGDET